MDHFAGHEELIALMKRTQKAIEKLGYEADLNVELRHDVAYYPMRNNKERYSNTDTKFNISLKVERNVSNLQTVKDNAS